MENKKMWRDKYLENLGKIEILKDMLGEIIENGEEILEEYVEYMMNDEEFLEMVKEYREVKNSMWKVIMWYEKEGEIIEKSMNV